MNGDISAGSDLNNNYSSNKFVEWVLNLLVFLTPLIFIPISISDLSSFKASFILLLIYLSIFVWIISKLKESKFKIPFNLISLSIFLIPLTYFLSAIFSENQRISFLGNDFSFDSVFVIISLLAFLFLNNFVLKEYKKVFNVYALFVVSSILLFIFHLIRIPLQEFVPDFGFFFDVVSNTIGKWFDLGIFAGIGIILSIISLEFSNQKRINKIFLGILFALSLIAVIVVGFFELWFVLGIFSLILFIYFLSISRIKKDENFKIPIFSLVVLVLSILFIIAGNQINPLIQDNLNIDFVEARPNIVSTTQIFIESTKENPVLGVGPARFSNAWIDYKSPDVNLSELWNTDFKYGYGFIPTQFINTGIIGTIVWLLFLGIFVYYGFVSVFRKFTDEKSRFVLISSFVISLYLWIMNIIFIPSYVTLFFTFLFSSIFIASLYRENIIKVKEMDITDNPKYGFIYIFKVVLLLIILIVSGYFVIEKYISVIYSRQSIIHLNQGDIQGAENKIISSLNLIQNDTNYRILSQIQQIKIGQIINNQNLTQEEISNAFQLNLSNAVSSAQSAISYDETNYLNHLELGRIFSSIIQFGIDGSYDQAKLILEKAREINPKNPSIVLELAKIEALSGNNENAKNLIGQSLELKQNYTEAVFLLAQIEVSEGKIDSAIENIRRAIIVRPNDPTTYFQLGILLYQKEEFNQAVGSFENAVILDPFYANAKYFLGLSYDRINRKDDAILQFEDLKILNPDNSEVQFILENLKQGNTPFFGAEEINPPIDDEPENRNDLPIEESEEINSEI